MRGVATADDENDRIPRRNLLVMNDIKNDAYLLLKVNSVGIEALFASAFSPGDLANLLLFVEFHTT